MTVYKNTDQKVEKFEFNQFSTPSDHEGEARKFDFEKIDPNTVKERKVDPAIIREERELATKNDFKVDSKVREYRGLKSQEEQDFQDKLDQALSAKYEELSKKAYEEGLEKGREAGRQEALTQANSVLEESIENMQAAIEDIKSHKDELLIGHKEDVYSIVKSISKWVALKEIREDESGYLEKLLVKLIAEINSKSSLSIKVSQNTYNLMPEVIDAVQKRVGELENVRYEVSPEIQSEGIIIESSNGIIDASLEAQFATIDKFFESGN